MTDYTNREMRLIAERDVALSRAEAAEDALERAQRTATPDALEFHPWPLRPAGGQHAGPVGYGVLVIHKPTGIAATSTTERSQLANKERAVARLQAVLAVLAAADAAFALSMEPRLEEAVEEARCQGLTGHVTTEGA